MHAEIFRKPLQEIEIEHVSSKSVEEEKKKPSS